MKTIKKSQQMEYGQVIPILVIGTVALIAMAALILDGGALLTNRRVAQNAADAAALAGARVFCKHEDYNIDDVNAAIELYATKNDATVIWDETGLSYDNLNVIEGLKKGEVVVTTQVSHDSFFARIFGEDALTAQAVAAAGCFPYGGSIVLPIAFPCLTPEGATPDGKKFIPSEDCDYVNLSWEYFGSVATNGKGIEDFNGCGMSANPLLEGVSPTETEAKCISDKLFEDPATREYIYVVVNENKFCADDPENVDPVNKLICNLTDTTRTQLNSAARGWLNLHTGPADRDTLSKWIEGINNPSVRVHNWFSFAPGAKTLPVFKSLDTRLYDIVWIPVFNEVCEQWPENGDCMSKAHVHPFEDPDGICEVIDGPPGQTWGHVVAYAPFFTTCVRIKDNPSDPSCPGFELAYQKNPEALANTNYSFEGYFIEPWWLDNPESIAIGGADLKIYIVSLTR